MSKAAGARSPLTVVGEFAEASIWRGYPNATIDAAWEALDHVQAMSVPKEEYERVGKLRDSNVVLPGGEYMASIEAFHQMHCVVSRFGDHLSCSITDNDQNLLRKYSYLDYYLEHEPDFFHSPMLRTHTDHCIEMLRQSVMCSADLHIITYDWVEKVDYPWPDFGISRSCRNYDALHDWAVKRTIDVDTADGFIYKPPGAAVRPLGEQTGHVHERN